MSLYGSSLVAMNFHGSPLFSMGLHWSSWVHWSPRISTGLHESPVVSTGLHGSPWISMRLHWSSQVSIRLWVSTGLHKSSWVSTGLTGLHRSPLVSTGFHEPLLVSMSLHQSTATWVSTGLRESPLAAVGSCWSSWVSIGLHWSLLVVMGLRWSPLFAMGHHALVSIGLHSQQTGTLRLVQSQWKPPWWGDHGFLVKWEVLGAGRHLRVHLLWLPSSSNCQGSGWGSGAGGDCESQEVCPSRPSIPIPTNRNGNLQCGQPGLHVLSPQPWQETEVNHRRPQLPHLSPPADYNNRTRIQQWNDTTTEQKVLCCGCEYGNEWCVSCVTST